MSTVLHPPQAFVGTGRTAPSSGMDSAVLNAFELQLYHLDMQALE